jgi:phosphopantetheinyl transferase
VGEDVQCVRAAAGALVASLFSPRELATHPNGGSSIRANKVARAWSCKEAIVKATGDGVRHSLADIGLDWAGSAPKLIHSGRYRIAEPDGWTIASFLVSPSHWAAVATPRPNVVTKLWRLESEPNFP